MKKPKNQPIILCLLIYMLCIVPADAQNAALPNSGVISDISENFELSLETSPIKIELANIYIPAQLHDFALKNLRELALDKTFEFEYVSNSSNRRGSFPAILKINNQTLQEQLISQGAALAYFLDIAENTSALFAAENSARKSGNGIWNNGDFQILNSEQLENSHKKYLGNFLIIEGVIQNTHLTKKNIFLNFGQKWRSDFSIQIDSKNLKQFPNFDPEKLTGKQVRVRGWLENYNGPFMKIFNLQNIEIQ